jgi:hypothetical protein
LRDAAHYLTSLPKKESDLPEWETAIEALMLCSHGGPTMMGSVHASAQPSCRAGVQPRAQRYPLGETEAQEGQGVI